MTEQYLRPKELSAALKDLYGRNRSADFVRAIRKFCVENGDRLFTAGEAKASELEAWIQKNPGFRSDNVYRKKLRRKLCDAFPVSNNSK